MPANDQQGQQQSENKTLIETRVLGLNLADAAWVIPDGAAVECENLMPYANGHYAVYPGPQLVLPAPAGHTISSLYAFTLGTAAYILALNTDGSMYVTPVLNPVWQIFDSSVVMTPGGFHVTKWQAADAQGNPEALLWCDTSHGYGSIVQSATPNQWHVNALEPTQTGQAIAVYAGRVWIASNQQITYTAPDTYNDFTLADYAGSFKITDPSMNGPVYALYGTQNWLYIVGSGMMALNNVQIQSVAGATTLSTTFFITPVSAKVGITNDRAAIVWDNVLLLMTNTGIWAYYGLNGQPITQNMGDNFIGNGQLMATQTYGKDLLFTSNGYVNMLNDQKWFTTFADALTWVSLTTLIWQGVHGYVTDGAHLYAVGANTAVSPTNPALRNCVLTTKLYDAGNASMNKRVMKAGYELWQDELLQPAPANLYASATMQVLGFQRNSQVFVDNNISANANNWIRHTASMTDRYFGMQLNLTAPPSIAVGAIFFQFQDSTPWP